MIEDQQNLAQLIKEGLEGEGFAVDALHDGAEGESRILMNHQDYDLIVLDIMLPNKDGISICQSVRAKKITTPVLILTSKDGTDNVIAGLNAGADDYLVKPFHFDELLARIRAILRRPPDSLPPELSINGLTLNPATGKVTKNGQELHLTLKEFRLLEYLMRHPNQVMNREQIIASLWDFSFDSFSNVVDVHVTNLRKKIGDRKGAIIETVHGIGYRFNAPS